MKKSKEDFFEQMRTYKTDTLVFDVICAGIMVIGLSIAYMLIALVERGKIQYSKIVLICVIICTIITLFAILAYFTVSFTKNGIRFLSGDFFAGLKSLFIIVVPICILLVIIYITLPSVRDFLNHVFTILATVVVGVLTMMGVHYSITRQQIAKNEENNLIFSISDKPDGLNNFALSNSYGNKSVQINLKNVSNNYGYLIGLYRICGCDVHQIGGPLPYLSIEPQSGYSITNIKMNFGDDQLMIVYKDISENYYYLLISSNYQNIESSGKCNMSFLKSRLAMTSKLEKSRQDTTGHSSDSSSISDDLLRDYDSSITERKEKTKPIYTVKKDGFDLISSEEGEILTDEVLLSKLRKERNRLSKENKMKAYMIFNNQQLVAMATYKPEDELSFIAIYGLGKKKYEMYGNIFLPIVSEHEKTKNNDPS